LFIYRVNFLNFFVLIVLSIINNNCGPTAFLLILQYILFGSQATKKANIMLANCSTPFSVLLLFVLPLLSMAPTMIDCQYYYEQSSFLAPPSPIPAPPTKAATTSLTIDRMARKGSSMDTMVDVTNRFGVAVLSTHSAGNKDNIAFSPYGLLSVIIALYEGAPRDSTTSRQMREAVGLPSDDAVLRVGYRDVHRRLRVRQQQQLNDEQKIFKFFLVVSSVMTNCWRETFFNCRVAVEGFAR
jgi:Serpin (serine protease inhibitor)